MRAVEKRHQRRIYQHLRRLFQDLPRELSSEPAAFLAIARTHASAQLIDAGCDLAAEVAWFLLNSLFHETDHGQQDELAIRNHILSLAPGWHEWMNYLATFPPGKEQADFRARRIMGLEIMLSGFHPGHELKRQYGLEPDTMPERARRFVTEHIRGPLVCLSCRSDVEKLQQASGDADATVALAAAAGHEIELDIELPSARGIDTYLLRCMDHQRYLRVFLDGGDDQAGPAVTYRLVFLFLDGHRMSCSFTYPDDEYAGYNCGYLGNRALSDISAVLVLPEHAFDEPT